MPRVLDGTLHYTLMEIVATGEPGNYWTLRLKATQPPLIPISATTTAATPGIVLPATAIHTHLGF